MSSVDPDLEIDSGDLAIWIDPIDSTQNYIYGKINDEFASKIGDREFTQGGLQVVTVLIGVFHRITGEALIGVINQPFAELNRESDEWRGQIYWGVSLGDNRKFYSESLKIEAEEREKSKVVLSFTEPREVKKKLGREWDLVTAAGAGYKMLSVALGFADAYATSKGSTYKWDTCAGHAILKAMGGNCLNLDLEQSEEISYSKGQSESDGVKRWANNKGLLAYKDIKEMEKVVELLKMPLDEEASENKKAKM